MIEAERSFAASAVELGMKRAFLNYLADDAVLFQPAPVHGQAVWRKRVETTARLSWHPTLVRIASSGDLGCTSGPWEYTPDAHLDQPPRYGHYVTMWRKKRDGSWKVITAIGVRHDYSAGADSGMHVVLPAVAVKARSKNFERKRLLDGERRLARRCMSDGLGVALAAELAEDARVMADGIMPLVGREQVEKDLPNARTRFSFRVAFASLSEACDLAYTYGAVTSVANRSVVGYFLRVWQKDARDRWKIVVNVSTSSRQE
ncbi:MAG TPA: DUF4440 domain-containing protein [Bacteroidota bacterium]|nr:DUF4440 domain-containing protein [Bacteroidota bacterium]